VSLHLGGDDKNYLLDKFQAMVRTVDGRCWEKEERKLRKLRKLR
jgi:hypothetical protein